MSKLRAVLCLVITLALPVALCGCPVAIVGGLAAAGGAGYTANQERGVTGTFDDVTIKTNIQNAWLQVNPLMQRDFTITVYEGRTLLTGMTPSPELKAQAAQVASQIPGVRAIYNEIEVAPGEGAWASVRDTWISSQIRSNLVFASQVRSVNYTIDTVNGSVYLIGSARTPGRARPRHRGGAERPQCEAGRLLRRDPAGRTRRRPAGSAAATRQRADARRASCRRAGDGCRGTETLI